MAGYEVNGWKKNGLMVGSSLMMLGDGAGDCDQVGLSPCTKSAYPALEWAATYLVEFSYDVDSPDSTGGKYDPSEP